MFKKMIEAHVLIVPDVFDEVFVQSFLLVFGVNLSYILENQGWGSVEKASHRILVEESGSAWDNEVGI